jgi:acetyl-CoA carboxylase biotin carboxyl carrier protein
MAGKPKSQPNAGVAIRGVDLGEVERLLAFMDRHNLEEFEYQRGNVHFRLKRASTHPTARPAPPAASSKAPASAAPSTPSAGGKHAETAGKHSDAAEPTDLHVIRSPIVGTFYSSPSPEADPFVAAGAKVAPGQVLCIIEAMKLMNEIESDVSGEVVKVFVESGQPVEYGEALFGIRPNGKK